MTQKRPRALILSAATRGVPHECKRKDENVQMLTAAGSRRVWPAGLLWRTVGRDGADGQRGQRRHGDAQEDNKCGLHGACLARYPRQAQEQDDAEGIFKARLAHAPRRRLGARPSLVPLLSRLTIYCNRAVRRRSAAGALAAAKTHAEARQGAHRPETPPAAHQALCVGTDGRGRQFSHLSTHLGNVCRPGGPCFHSCGARESTLSRAAARATRRAAHRGAHPFLHLSILLRW